jgi:hypothetical protein
MTSTSIRTPLTALRLFLVSAFAALAAACGTTKPALQPLPRAPDIGLYELRSYTAADGKLEALTARLRDHEAPLFRKHGMIPVAFFQTAPGPGQPEASRLYYILGYKDRAARDAAWTAFSADPDWKSAYKTTGANGALQTQIDNVFLQPASYSPKLNLDSRGAPRLFELRTYTANPGKLEAIHDRFRDHTLGLFQKHGMTSILYWRPTAGQDGGYDSKMVYMLAYPNLAARNADWAAFSADPDWIKASNDSQKNGVLLKGKPDTVFLTPLPFSPLK